MKKELLKKAISRCSINNLCKHVDEFLVFLTAIAEGDGCLWQTLIEQRLGPIRDSARIEQLRFAKQAARRSFLTPAS